ncbi:MAG: hypothetical protein Q7R30_10565 [Acidobacteriota bacterium]|nr:hypothetical protein [Acidobacteriota bacterium]
MRARDRLLNFLRGWALLTAALPMLIVYRAAVQPRYQWGLFGMFGQGITPGYFVVVAAALLAWAAVVFGTLRSRAAGPLFVALNAVWFASILIGVIRQGQRMSVRGDALGANINLAIVGPILFGALLMLSAYWWWRRGNASPPAVILPLAPWRRVLLGIALVLLPVIVVLFGLGDGLPHTWKDQLAVVCVIVQVVAVGAALRNL